MNLPQIIDEHRDNPRELAAIFESLLEQSEARGWIKGKAAAQASPWITGLQALAGYIGGSKTTASRLLSAMRACGVKVPGTERMPMLLPEQIDQFLRENPNWRDKMR